MKKTGQIELKWKILTLMVLLVLVVSSCAIILRYKIHVGDTVGLEDKVFNIHGVEIVENYKVYERTASFILVFESGSIGLNSVTNAGLERYEGVNIFEIDGERIHCKLRGSTISSPGFTARALQLQYFPKLNLDTVPNIVENYDSLREILKNEFLDFTFVSNSHKNSVDIWRCEFRESGDESIRGEG